MEPGGEKRTSDGKKSARRHMGGLEMDAVFKASQVCVCKLRLSC